MYVDDVQSGHSTVEGALERGMAAGMELQKWAANNPSLLHGIHLIKSDNFWICHSELHKKLGLYWHPHFDYYDFKIKFELVWLHALIVQ